jgi:hypothetical protein
MEMPNVTIGPNYCTVSSMHAPSQSAEARTSKHRREEWVVKKILLFQARVYLPPVAATTAVTAPAVPATKAAVAIPAAGRSARQQGNRSFASSSNNSSSSNS